MEDDSVCVRVHLLQWDGPRELDRHQTFLNADEASAFLAFLTLLRRELERKAAETGHAMSRHEAKYHTWAEGEQARSRQVTIHDYPELQ